jgi:hypothetical protein
LKQIANCREIERILNREAGVSKKTKKLEKNKQKNQTMKNTRLSRLKF